MKSNSKVLTKELESRVFELSGQDGYYQLIKRIFDIFVAATVLLISSPLIAASLVAVKFTSEGPLLYRSKRAGLGGQSFDMLKIRTMYNYPEDPDRRITAAHDDRITSVGSLLRKFKIDELPQLWNVLRGEMSIIGPRPEDFNIAKQYFTGEQKIIFSVRPGIASPVDVHWYPDLTFHDPPLEGVTIQEWYIERHLPVQLAEGLNYVEQQSLLLDIKVLLQTMFCILIRSWLPPKRREITLASSGVVNDGAFRLDDKGEY